MPNSHVYFENDGYSGSTDAAIITGVPSGATDFAFLCNGTTRPVVPLAAEINGVVYPINSADLLQVNDTLQPRGYCNVGIVNSTTPNTILGLPFMRSVYM